MGFSFWKEACDEDAFIVEAWPWTVFVRKNKT